MIGYLLIMFAWTVFGLMYGVAIENTPLAGLITGLLAGMFHVGIVGGMDLLRATNKEEST